MPPATRKTPHTNVKEERCTFPTRPPSTSGSKISTSVPGACAFVHCIEIAQTGHCEREHDRCERAESALTAVLETMRIASSALARSGRYAAVARAGARAHLRRIWRSWPFTRVGVDAPVRAMARWHLHPITCGGAHMGTRVEKREMKTLPQRNQQPRSRIGPHLVSRAARVARGALQRGEDEAQRRRSRNELEGSRAAASEAACPLRGCGAARPSPPPARTATRPAAP